MRRFDWGLALRTVLVTFCAGIIIMFIGGLIGEL